MRAADPPVTQDSADTIAALQERVAQLEEINAVLIDRVERSTDLAGHETPLFETAILLDSILRARAVELAEAKTGLDAANAQLASARNEVGPAQRRLQDAIESLSDGFALFDADDRLIMCNSAYLRFWPELEGETAQTPSFSEIARRVADQRSSTGSVIATERWLADRMHRHHSADGAHIQALADGRWVQINEFRTAEGGTAGIYTDITEVKAQDARERARELAEKSMILQTTLDTIPLGVALYDCDRRLIAWNGPLLSSIGLGADSLASIMTYQGMIDACRRAQRSGGEDAQLAWLADGSAEPASVLHTKLGRIIEILCASMPGGGMVMTFEDATERRAAAQTLERRVAERTAKIQVEIAERRAVQAQLVAAKDEAERANRSKTKFLAAASHDLLQPLNAARLFVAALGERRLALQTRALVRQAGVALDSVDEMLEALFEISRLDTGAIQPDLVAIDLARMVNALGIEFGAVARNRGIGLNIAETRLWVRSDLRLLRRILQNFLSNAMRYTQEGSVTLSFETVGPNVRISVADTGPGIAPADREVIFEEFRRLDKDRKLSGTGLGLAIVRRAAAVLGHKVELHSELGQGSVFSILVQICEPETLPPTRPIAGADPLARATIRILIIDNEDAILSGMEAVLSNWNYDVVTARDAAAAMMHLDKGIDIIIADYHLDANASGDDVISALRTRAGRAIPALIITADRTDDLQTKLAALDFPLLRKPVKPARLRALLRTMIQ